MAPSEIPDAGWGLFTTLRIYANQNQRCSYSGSFHLPECEIFQRYTCYPIPLHCKSDRKQIVFVADKAGNAYMANCSDHPNARIVTAAEDYPSLEEFLEAYEDGQIVAWLEFTRDCGKGSSFVVNRCFCCLAEEVTIPLFPFPKSGLLVWDYWDLSKCTCSGYASFLEHDEREDSADEEACHQGPKMQGKKKEQKRR